MKKLIFILPILLISCWDKTPDGKEYRIICNCLVEHNVIVSVPITTIINNVPITTMLPQTTWICDYEVCDTLWRKK